MPKAKQKVRFDDEVGGAISQQAERVRTEPLENLPTPAQKGIQSLYRDLESGQEYDFHQMQSFIDNLEQTPKLLEPFSSFEYLYSYEHDGELSKNLQRDVTGHGARGDKHHVQRMVYKSLEQHPEILGVYLKGKV